MAHGDDNWEQLLDECGPALLVYARQFVRSVADADDLCQEAFVRFWKARSSARDPKAYLFSCLKNSALETKRAEKRLKARERIVGDIERPLFVVPVENDERRREIEAALSSLPEEQRETVVMKIWGGLTFPQIGEVSGVSADTAASRYRYAMQALKQKLAQEVAR